MTKNIVGMAQNLAPNKTERNLKSDSFGKEINLQEYIKYPRSLWGKIIIYLREHKCVALHIACGDIGEVSFDGEVFTIFTQETFIYDLLQNPDNVNELTNAFNSFGIKKYNIVKKDKPIDKANYDIEILKKVVGDYLIIKESKQ